MTAEQSATQPAKTKPFTGYVVLREFEGPTGKAWIRVDSADARKPADAIKEALKTIVPDEQAGVYMAIPARSFQPVKVTPRVETRLLIEEAN